MSRHRHQHGFTLIEMLVSLALFTIVGTISVGVLLVLVNGNGRVVNEQVVTNSLTYALDSMSREIRTGSEYYCATANTARGITSSSSVLDCSTGNTGLSFREAGESITGGNTNSRISYYFLNGMLYRRVGLGTEEPLLNNDVVVNDVQFFVSGTEPLTQNNTNRVQPTVTIVVTGAAASEPTRTFTVQTTITQRPLDI